MIPQADDQKNGLIKKSKNLLDQAVSGLKGRDLNTLVDEFTQEMTVVAEGLSEELTVARHELAQLAASQTLLEEGRTEDMQGLEVRLNEIDKRLAALEKQREKQLKRSSFLQILRQLTVISVIIAAAWVLVAVLKVLGGP